MSEFQTYLLLGFEHISDLKGYDHIVFLIALCAVYQLRDWRKVLVLVTAFTIGHSLTLALATLGVVIINSTFVEFLIPVTILLTAIYNLSEKSNDNFKQSKPHYLRYFVALGFGLIHGLGFSNFLREMSKLMNPGEGIISKLLAFNIGLELGQLLIVLFILVFSYFLIPRFRHRDKDWKVFLSGMSTGIALILLINSDFVQNLLYK